ncbi:MAG TPA: hypothetical protein PKA27_03805 [Fimbriimonadaceae bacterium]|nr:hypothetical protein [Fimbriimonadaceae bacterium]
MKEFNDLSGPWQGWSIQDGLRISERLVLSIRENRISGTGSDKDGEFEIVGTFSPRNSKVELTRRYTVTTEPSQSGVGIPYDYEGQWDGALVFGRWSPRSTPWYGGPFEMWPDDGSGGEYLRNLVNEVELAASG